MKKVIGVIGPGKSATEQNLKNAYEIGRYSSSKGYVTLTGGRKAGVMEDALKGAKESNGLTIGVLPGYNKSKANDYVDLAIITNMASGRNYINALSSDIVIACGIGSGTSAEISLALKEEKKVILVGLYEEANAFYKKLEPNQIFIAKDYNEAIKILDNEDW